MFFRAIILLISVFIFTSCNTKNTVIEEEEPELISCSNATIKVVELDSIALPGATYPIYWKGAYTDSKIKINFTRSIGNDNETESFIFVFNKVDGCLKVERAYKFYDGKLVDTSAVTEMDVVEFYTQDWEEDKKFTGIISYIDPHDKNTYTRKFWINFKEDDFILEPTNFLLFNDCFGDTLPLEIDMNNDGTFDYNLSFETKNNIGNKPRFTEYHIKLISSNYNTNYILSPERNESPYFVVFEPPFSSENTKQYFNGVRNDLDVFYDFEAPYKKYNFFLNNNLTYKKTLKNNLDDYYVVSMLIEGKLYYGWIKFNFNSENCTAEIIETYLNPNANEHIYVN